MDAQVKVDGIRALRREAKRAGVDLDDLRDAHAQAAAVVSRAAAAAAPHVSGRLASSVRSSGTKTAGVVRAGTARVPYAGPIHWGWGRRHIAAQPFMTEAAAATEPTWVPVYLEAVQRTLDRVADAVRGRD